MRCRKAERLLPDYLEHRGDPLTETLVGEHVAGCERCRNLAEGFKATLSLLSDDPVPPMPLPPEQFLQTVRRRARQQSLGAPRKSSLVFRWIPPLAAAAALVLAAGIVWQSRVASPARTTDGELQTMEWPGDPFAIEASVPLDPLDTGYAQIDRLAASEEPSFDGIEAELFEGSELDDLIDDMAPAEQAELLQKLELAYGIKHN